MIAERESTRDDKGGEMTRAKGMIGVLVLATTAACSVPEPMTSGESQEGIDLSYRLLLRDPDRVDELLTEVRTLNGASRVTSLKAEQESEL